MITKHKQKKVKTQSKTCIIPKLCKTKYKAFKLRNPSVILGSSVDSIYDSSAVMAMNVAQFFVVLLFF